MILEFILIIVVTCAMPFVAPYIGLIGWLIAYRKPNMTQQEKIDAYWRYEHKERREGRGIWWYYLPMEKE